MKTFFNLLQTVVNIKEKRYPDEPFKLLTLYGMTSEQNHIMYIINQIFYNEKKEKNKDDYSLKCSTSVKFSVFDKLLENSFILTELKELLLDVWYRAQKHYYAFLRLAHIYKTKKYPIVVNTDLSLNLLDQKNCNTFILIEKKSKYLFTIHNLISIIETSISNSYHFFSEPIWPSNPYNKQSFSVSTLYNIYFKMKYSGRVMSTLFHLFFTENFDLSSFSQNHECTIRHYSIRKYVFNTPYNDLYNAVLNMLHSNVYTKKLSIHSDFPKDILVGIFRPFLYYYYTINYDIKGTNKISNFKIILNKKLKKFYEYNKAFGRKFIKLIMNSEKRVIKKEYLFNTKHLPFNKINISDGLVVLGIAVPILNSPLQYAQHVFEINEVNDDDDDDDEDVEEVLVDNDDGEEEEEEDVEEDDEDEDDEDDEEDDEDDEDDEEELDSVS
jgi:hypothetical protein